MSDTVEFGVDSSTESIFQKAIYDFGLSSTYLRQKWLAHFEFYSEYKNSVMDLSF